ncbi:MAG: ferrous iron transporter B [Peptococcaceae bacterium]|jgi:ferrous iron transport protein B|nr:ferrous iron transporter B [Peptococcaceae bacterium]
MNTVGNKTLPSEDPLIRLYVDLADERSACASWISDRVVGDIFSNAQTTARQVLQQSSAPEDSWQNKLDRLVTSRRFGYPFMFLLLIGIFWLTISGSNVPSTLLAQGLFALEDWLRGCFLALGSPAWLHGLLISGVYHTLAWVVSVMLPPMAIFFPLFTYLEDLGYLPRVAFNLDHLFQKANACGKQCLTMCMGFGCNAAGVVSTRIIHSPRERLIAILTNNFVPCNGRFPTLIAIATIFTTGGAYLAYQQAAVAAAIAGVIFIGLGFTFLISWGLAKTVLQGESSSLVLELPPYRRPQFWPVLYRSLIDRTLFVLRRAVFIAAPAGAIIWLLSNCYWGDANLITHAAAFLDPFARFFGLDGFILMAFILGLPANEIVIPILLMSYLSSASLQDIQSLAQLRGVLLANGWTWLTAVNVLLFSLLHWPCSTTLLSIYKETGSLKWTLLAFALPSATAFSMCLLVTQVARLLGL